MSYRYEKNLTGGTDLVIDGFENGIANSPHKGLGNLQNVNTSTETGEAMCSFDRVIQSQTGTTGTLTQVNTNTVSITGITLLVGQVITITDAGTTGLSGNYYYLSTGKLYAGSMPPSDPDSATAVTGITAGSATFSITYPLGNPFQSATEPYYSSGVRYYRYYIMDSLGQIWCHDTKTLSNWDTPLWFFVGTVGAGGSGLAIYNGWLTATGTNGLPQWKLTSLLGGAFINSVGSSFFQTKFTHFMLSGSQGFLYGTDGNSITSLFADSSLVGDPTQDNVQSYAQYFPTLGSDLVINGSFTGSATGWTLGAAWLYNSNAVDKNADGTNTLSQNVTGALTNVTGILTFTISNYTVGTVQPKLGTDNIGLSVSANGTYTSYFYSEFGGTLSFVPSNTARFTVDSVSLKLVTAPIDVIGGSNPTSGFIAPRIPAIFFTNGTLPSAISASTIYYIQYYGLTSTIQVFAGVTGGAALDIYTGAVGRQYFNTFDPSSAAGTDMLEFDPVALSLPFYEVATSMAELGSTLIVGGISNALYPWDQNNAVPGDIIFLSERGVVNLLTVNNMCYVFAGNKGNIYITSGSAVSPVIKIPDYCAGIPGSPSTYIEPNFTWGGSAYMRGRIYCSIQDQTTTKTGNCGGIWSFIPTNGNFINQDVGTSLRLENQSSYGTYSGGSLVILPSQDQNVIAPQYWTGWYSSITSPTYGIDFTDTVPVTIAVIETDLIPTGTVLTQQTFTQLEYKLSAPLAIGESVSMEYRQNATDAYQTCGASIVESATSLAGYFRVNFQKGQWLQLRATENSTGDSNSSFVRLKQIRVNGK